MGVYRRRMRVVALDERTVRGDMEDDFHRFGVTLHHDGAFVTEVIGDATRHPWTTCPSAIEPLRALRGAPLSTRLSALGEHAPARQNCTHLFDLAGLAVTHAARGSRGSRTYDVAIPDRDGPRTEPALWQDGELLFRWRVNGRQIEGPAPFTDVSLRGNFIAWAEATLDAGTAEAASVLRRACDISFGRMMDLDLFERATMLGERVHGTCHSFQPGTIDQAVRVKGQTRDFTDDPDALLA
jgi:hypothetical protein